MSKLLRRMRGQMMVLIAIAIVALLGALALCADVAVFYFNWSELQKAADASALAGANYLPENTALARATAATYVQSNGSSAGEIVTNQVGSGALGPNTTLTVGLQRTVPYYFARVLGLINAPVHVQAVAGIQNVGGASGFIPIGLACNQALPLTGNCGYKQGVLYQIHEGVGAGNWELLAPPGMAGAADVRTEIVKGYQGPQINIGSTIQTEPGTAVGPVDQGFNTRLGTSAYPDGAPPAGYNPGDSRVVLVPLVNYTGVAGKSVRVPVLGFVAMWIASRDKGGVINAYFLNAVAGDPSPSAGGPPTGAVAPVLLQ